MYQFTNPSTILIVGHGPSLSGAMLGQEIDKYPVCRLKVFTRFHNDKDYGSRTDYICATDSIIAGAIKCNPHATLWVYCKLSRIKIKLRVEAEVPMHLTNKWNEWFQKRCNWDGINPKGRNYSIGAAAGIIALEKGFKRIIFAGCDTLMNPNLDYVSVYNPKTVQHTHHLWWVEHEMLHICAKQKGAQLCALSPHGVIPATKYTAENF